MPPLEEYVEEISSIWESRWLTNMGEKHQRLESELADYLKVPNITLFTNGHMALELTLQALAHGDSGQTGHHHVTDNKVRLLHISDTDALFAIGCLIDLIFDRESLFKNL